MSRLFGTDGVRGVANKDLTARLSLRLGEAAARVLSLKSKSNKKRAIVGRDTRVSGEFISAAVSAGLASAGLDVIDVGIIPTPGIAYLTSKLGVDLGVMISASHNAMPDNGIKFFSSNGYKLEDSIEDEIEAHIEEPWDRPVGVNVGHIMHDKDVAVKHYIDHLVNIIKNKDLDSKNDSSVNEQPFKGLKIVVDSANGAASIVAPEVLRMVGADVTVINSSPDGYNINEDSGSTHPSRLQAMVVACGADLGVAFDGDADRCIAVDEKGAIVDGDKIITLLAQHFKDYGVLKNDTVALTTMTNLGAKMTLKSSGINIEITDVGDRYVLERMLEKGISLGGEQSGHIINLNHSTTGDGILSALYLCDMLIDKRNELASKVELSELSSKVLTLPQVLINVKDVDKSKISDPQIMAVVKSIESELKDKGRILLRPSGTEPLIRVMVEAETNDLANRKAQELADCVAQVARLK